MMKVLISVPNGPEDAERHLLELDVAPDETLDRLKDMIEAEEGIKPEHQKIFFGGKRYLPLRCSRLSAPFTAQQWCGVDSIIATPHTAPPLLGTYYWIRYLHILENEFGRKLSHYGPNEIKTDKWGDPPELRLEDRSNFPEEVIKQQMIRNHTKGWSKGVEAEKAHRKMMTEKGPKQPQAAVGAK